MKQKPINSTIVLCNASFHNRALAGHCIVYPSRPSELFCDREEYFPCRRKKRGTIVLNGERGKEKSGKRRNEQTRPKKMDRPVISPPPIFRFPLLDAKRVYSPFFRVASMKKVIRVVFRSVPSFFFLRELHRQIDTYENRIICSMMINLQRKM